ncbi:hypothetical protein GCK32_010482 [Trichostrongylus colubriformis]|uniref:Uncharacterized protein n=1 Tax=Trichostrongylus colubriformis TaxID=6319 RepID=A0AAN8F387_TRICO
MMTSNSSRKEEWNNISMEIWKKFDLRLSPAQIQTHFNNRKRRVMTPESIGKKYQSETGMGRVQMLEDMLEDARRSRTDADMNLYRYFCTTLAYRKDEVMETWSPWKDEAEARATERPARSKSLEIPVNVDDEVLGDSSEEDEDKLQSRHCVSEAEIRKWQKAMLKSEKKMFDSVTHMCSMQLRALEEMVIIQRRLMDEVERLFKEWLPSPSKLVMVPNQEMVVSHEVVCDSQTNAHKRST